MKIVKRISLHQGIQRSQEPSLAAPWFHRFTFTFHKDYHITPRLQLMKYGYRSKPHNRWIKLFYMSFFAFGIFCSNYMIKLYLNELQTIHPYRYIQQQHSSIWVKGRMIIAKLFIHISNQLFIEEFTNKTNKLHESTQGQLRYLQYDNYMKKRNNDFDFVDIGVLENFPYPKLNKTQG